MARFALTADWHCDQAAYGRHPTMTGDSLFGLQQIVDYCVDPENKISVLLAAGDLYDGPSPTSTVQMAVHRQLDRLRSACIPVWHIQGQHENCAKVPRLDTSLNVTHLDGIAESYDQFKVAGLDYRPRDQLLVSLKEVALLGPKLLMLHQVWSDFMGSVADCQAAFSELPDVPWVLTGDYHVAEVRPKQGPKKRTTVVSPGSTHMRSIDETQEKSFQVLDTKTNKLTQVPLLTRPFLRMYVHSEFALGEFLKKLKAFLKPVRDDLPRQLRSPYVVVDFEEPAGDVEKVIRKFLATDPDLLQRDVSCFLYCRPVESANTKLTLDDIDIRDTVSADQALAEVVDETSEEFLGVKRFLDGAEGFEAAYEQLRSDFFAAHAAGGTLTMPASKPAAKAKTKGRKS